MDDSAKELLISQIKPLEEDLNSKENNKIKVPHIEQFGKDLMVVCPTCNYAMIKSIGDYSANYCSNCGQKFFNGYLVEMMPRIESPKKRIIDRLTKREAKLIRQDLNEIDIEIHKNKNYKRIDKFMCSNCGQIMTFLDGHISLHKYCFHCGKKIVFPKE